MVSAVNSLYFIRVSNHERINGIQVTSTTNLNKFNRICHNVFIIYTININRPFDALHARLMGPPEIDHRGVPCTFYHVKSLSESSRARH